MIIRIKNMRLAGIVGVNPWERTKKQAIVINVEFEFDGSRAAQSDSIEATVDYRTASDKIAELVATSEFFLIETLAERILQIITSEPLINRARVEVDKPGAISLADSTSVEVSWARYTASDTTNSL